MYNNFKIVCLIPAGRLRYMQYIVPQILSSDIVDRLDLWVNTNDNFDVEFMRQLEQRLAKVHLCYHPEKRFGGFSTLMQYWQYAKEPGTLYLRFDDDLIWIEPDLIEKLVKFRMEHRDYLFVSPLVINNASGAWVLQTQGKIKLTEYNDSYVVGPLFWQNPFFAKEIHAWFLDNYVDGDRERLYCGENRIAMARFSINCMAWFGEDMAEMTDYYPVEGEEEYISVLYPAKVGKINCIWGGAICAHFSFYNQRRLLDRTNILSRYAQALIRRWENDSKGAALYATTQEIMNYLEDNKNEIISKEKAYPASPSTSSLKMTLSNWKSRLIVGSIYSFKQKRYRKHIIG